MKTTFISFEEFEDDEFKPPCTKYIKTATGCLYIHCRSDKDANDYIKEEWNGKYNLRKEQRAQIR